ncbi:MAG: hypothetical protein KKF95_06335, partial [Nanoarchaeota archaeon]|nr:hypothetical protein [Nanoarchaeota archaeon]
VNIKELIRRYDFEIVVMDCHWYYFIHGVQELARICKEINPECIIIIGGFSANFFRRELLKHTKSLDIIIKGDSESLLPKLCNQLFSKKKKGLRNIPNIAYKNVFGVIKDNKISVFDNNIDEFDYVDLTFMLHWKEYLHFQPGEEGPGISQRFNQERFFYLPTQKGCINACPSCGGSTTSYRLLSNKKGFCVRSPKKIIEDITKINSLGINNIMISCQSKFNKWVLILKELEKRKVFVNMMFEDWSLPKKDFVKQMISYSKNKESGFLISPLCGNEDLRKKNGKMFTNEELFEFTRLISQSEHSYATVWFSPNLVGATKKSFEETILLAKELERMNLNSNKNNIQNLVGSMELDLTSDMYQRPDFYNHTEKLWDFDYFISFLKGKKEGKNLGNMSYISQEISVSDSNEMINRFNKEMQLLKKRILFSKKEGHFSGEEDLEIEKYELKDEFIDVYIKNNSEREINLSETGVRYIGEDKSVFEKTKQVLKPGRNKIRINFKRKIWHFIIRTEDVTAVGLKV